MDEPVGLLTRGTPLIERKVAEAFPTAAPLAFRVTGISQFSPGGMVKAALVAASQRFGVLQAKNKPATPSLPTVSVSLLMVSEL